MLSTDEDADPPPISYRKIFREHFPFYIHLGMTYDEYWRMDCELVRDYRKAYELKQEYDNSQLWLQGLYVYKALEAQRPGWVFYGKKPPKPETYLEKPLAVTEEMKIRYQNEQTRKMAEALKAKFHKSNQKFKQGGGEDGESKSRSLNDSSQF